MDYVNGRRDGPQQHNWPTIFGCNMLYFIVLALMILLSGAVGVLRLELADTGQWLTATFIMEILVIGIPPVLYLLLRKIDIRQTVRLNKTGVKELLLVLGMAVSGYGIVSFINLVWYWILSRFGTPVAPVYPPINNGGQYITGLLVMALTPALVEEFLFRGVMLRGYERLGTKVSIITTGVLFAVLHLRITNIPAIIFLGIMIGYVVVRTNSIFSGVLYHFTQNAISISLLYFQEIARDYLQDAGAVQDNMANIPPEMWIGVIIVWGMIALFSIGFFLLCVTAFHRTTRFRAEAESPVTMETRVLTLKEMLPLIGSGIIVAITLLIEIMAMIGKI